MRVLRGFLLLMTALGGSTPALATAGVEPARPAVQRLVELVSPRAGVPLRAGSTAVLQWAPLPALESLPARQEWEAFLSVDGGRSYPFRITPHLDSDLRRTLWQVPDVASLDARLLLRFGDEDQETVVELPESLTIAPTPFEVLRPAVPAPSPGEPARPGDPGIVAWTEGSRRGNDEREVAVAPARLREGIGWHLPSGAPEAAEVNPNRSQPRPPALHRGPLPDPDAAALATAPPPSLEPRPSVDRLLQTRRRNE